MTNANNFQVVSTTNELRKFLPDIQRLADSETNALGFLPAKAYEDAVYRNQILALVDETNHKSKLAGYILHSGVFPNARIQQIATVKSYRNSEVGSTLIRTLVSDLEKIGFISLRADIANDLSYAKKFYQKNQFYPSRITAGGQSRQRKINVHIRDLDSPTLFNNPNSRGPILGFRKRSSPANPIYTLDLNIFLDLTKNRQHTTKASELFSTALRHEIRIAVAREFIQELERASENFNEDPILKLARQLPKLPEVPSNELKSVTAQIHKIVFGDRRAKKADSKRAWSDASHLAHSALVHSKAFVTRDSALIRKRSELIQQFGIDVVSLDDLHRLLPRVKEVTRSNTKVGQNFIVADGKPEDIKEYMARNEISRVITDEFAPQTNNSFDYWQRCIRIQDKVAGIAVLISPRTPDRVCKLFVHCEEISSSVRLYAEHLIDITLREASLNAVSAVEFELSAGQPTVLELIKSKGFFRTSNKSRYEKIAVGRPISAKNWDILVPEIHRRTGIILTEQIPTKQSIIEIENQNRDKFKVSRTELEELLEPTIILWNDINGVIVPIRSGYSRILLGVSGQESLFVDKNVEFLSRRSYVGDARKSTIMKPNTPILFYESKGKSTKERGEGAIIAIARIVDSVIQRKTDVSPEVLERTVFNSIEEFKDKDVLVTSFDNIFRSPNPVPLQFLRKIGAADGANLVTARSIKGQLVNKIVDSGWPNG